MNHQFNEVVKLVPLVVSKVGAVHLDQGSTRKEQISPLISFNKRKITTGSHTVCPTDIE